MARSRYPERLRSGRHLQRDPGWQDHWLRLLRRDLKARRFQRQDTGAKLFEIGYEHSLSKRTILKAVYAHLNNDKKRQLRLRHQRCLASTLRVRRLRAGPLLSLGTIGATCRASDRSASLLLIQTPSELETAGTFGCPFLSTFPCRDRRPEKCRRKNGHPRVAIFLVSGCQPISTRLSRWISSVSST